MSFVHLIFAVLATLRLVELFLLDKVTARLRTRFPGYIWQCSRCLSVWAGAWVTLTLALSQYAWWTPYLNWPFALSWLMFTYNDWITGRRMANRGRQFLVTLKDGRANVDRNEMQPDELMQIFQGIIQSAQEAQSLPTSQANGKASAIMP